MADEKKNWLGPYIPQGNLLREVIQQIKLVYYLMTDRRVHPLAKLIPVAAVALILAPINLPIEAIPVIGQLDDAAIVMLAMRLFFEVVPPAVVREHLQRLAQPITDEEWHGAFHPPEPDRRVTSNAAPPAPPAPEDVVEGSFKVVDEVDPQNPQR
jgi:uncharacterized membrane protein YkvA (DUF1232 family)